MKTAEQWLEEALGEDHDLKVREFKRLRDAMKAYALDCHEQYVQDRKESYDTDTCKASDVLWQDLITP